MDFITQFTVEQQPDSQVELTGEIPFAELEKERGKAIAHLGKDLKIDGFRPGHVPDKVVVERLGEMAVLSEMAERAIARVYPAAIKELNIEAIGYPQITITKIAPDNPLGFTAVTAVLPETTLPDYVSIAQTINTKKPDILVTDEDVDAAIKDIMRQKIAYERMQASAAAGETHTHADGSVHPGPAHDEVHSDGTDLPTPDTVTKPADEPELPELTDDYAKSLGQFESVADLQTKLREHLTIEKEREGNAAHRAKITDAITEETKVTLPQVLVDSELEQMLAQMDAELTRANLRMDDYLQHIKKTKEDLFTEWKPAAEKRAILQLVLNEIAKKESVETDQAAEEAQIAQLMEQHPDADRERVRIYVRSVMQNEAVMKLLEAQ